MFRRLKSSPGPALRALALALASASASSALAQDPPAAQDAASASGASSAAPLHSILLGAAGGAAFATSGSSTQGSNSDHAGVGAAVGYRFEALPQNSSHNFVLLDVNGGFARNGARLLPEGNLEAEAGVVPRSPDVSYTLGARLSTPSLETNTGKIFVDVGAVGVGRQGQPLYILLTADLGALFLPALSQSEYAGGARLEVMDQLNDLVRIRTALEYAAITPDASSLTEKASNVGHYERADLGVSVQLRKGLWLDVNGSIEDARQKWVPLSSQWDPDAAREHGATGAAAMSALRTTF